MESLVIRPFTPSDQDRVTEIFTDWNRHIAAPDTANAFEAYIRRSIAEEMGRIPDYYQAHPKSGFWVAEIDGDVAGMVGIEVERLFVGLDRLGPFLGICIEFTAPQEPIPRRVHRSRRP